ncbi:MAG: asparagine synthase (glutamine-hydrolyzing) [Gemmatimonadetes bacterium]|nr:asparagine synthase (glutamine-hydrolyzing) [Gemmatimonadota bacterium]
MCGFAGILTRSPRSDGLDAATRKMIEPIVHRGPDDQGVWMDEEAGVALGFRRLAILDLSELGHQPMTSASARYTVAFNGEVYNFARLRAELEGSGARFRGHSDTEVMLAAFERWGIADATRRFVGMFAMAVWDAKERELSLIRDRLGKKPLFVYAEPGLVTFGSELKSLVAGPSFDRTLDREALTDYLRYMYVPGARTIYARARKLLPGHILTIRDAGRPLPEPVPYWSLEEVARSGAADPFRGGDEEAVAEFDALLGDAVALRMRADVPVGALLSGGIDSSLVVALSQAQAARPIRTFSVAFAEEEHNEAHHAARIARHLGTDHTEVMLTGRDVLDVVPRLPDIFDEPHSNPSALPVHLVCATARRHVTVALSGDGGDEVYGGYNRYTYGERVLPGVLRIPAPARRLVAAGAGGISTDSWNRAYRAGAAVLPPRFQQRLPGEKIQKIVRLMGSGSLSSMYESLVCAWPDAGRLVVGAERGPGTVARILDEEGTGSFFHRMLLTDQRTHLVDDQLAKVDRMSMASSLELRTPLLDHRLVEFSWRLPAEMKLRGGEGKWLLRQVLYRHVPRELLDRPKMGFSVPIDRWLRGPLRAWAEELLTPDRLEKGGIFHAAPIRRAWKDLLAGHGEQALGMWTVLSFQNWRERWLA